MRNVTVAFQRPSLSNLLYPYWPLNRFDTTLPWQVRDLVIFFSNIPVDYHVERVNENNKQVIKYKVCQHISGRVDFRIVMSKNMMQAYIEVINDDRLFKGPEIQIQGQKVATYFFPVFRPHVDEEMAPRTFAGSLFNSMRQIAQKSDICEAIVYAAFGRTQKPRSFQRGVKIASQFHEFLENTEGLV